MEYGRKTHVWVQMNSNEPKSMSKGQLFYNSYHICLCGATLVAWELGKVVLIE